MQFKPASPHESGQPGAPTQRIFTSPSLPCMPHAQLTEAVRHRVAQTFAELGVAAGGLKESILIRGGAYCGRRFDAAAGHAIWFLEENQIKFYDATGRLAEVAATSEPEPKSQRLAA